MLNQFASWSVIAKWAAGSGVFGLIVYFLVDEAAFRRLVRLMKLIILMLFVLLLLLLAAWWCYAHGGEQLLIHYFGRAGIARHAARHGQRRTAAIG
jgi:4-amino-4-deoxy-L-arabinose transferase-like glycosyltransferase